MNIYRVHVYNPVTAKISITQVNKESHDEAIDMVMKTFLPIHKLLKVEFLNEYGNWEPVVQVAITPVDGRIETGPLKINDDHCGYFIRGDNALGLAFDVHEVEDWWNNLPSEHKKDLWLTMPNIISFIKEFAKCRNQ